MTNIENIVDKAIINEKIDKAITESRELYNSNDKITFLINGRELYIAKCFWDGWKRHFIDCHNLDENGYLAYEEFIEVNDMTKEDMTEKAFNEHNEKYTIENLPQFYWHKRICSLEDLAIVVGNNLLIGEIEGIESDKIRIDQKINYQLEKDNDGDIKFVIQSNNETITSLLMTKDSTGFDARAMFCETEDARDFFYH